MAQPGDSYVGKNPASWSGLPLVGTTGTRKKMMAASTTRKNANALVLLFNADQEIEGEGAIETNVQNR